MIKKDNRFSFFGVGKDNQTKRKWALSLQEEVRLRSNSSVFDEVFALTCDVLDSFSRGKKGLSSASKQIEEAEKNGVYSAPVIQFVSQKFNEILKDGVAYSNEDKEQIARTIFDESLKNEKLLRFDFYQYRQLLAESFTQEDRRFFFGMCDLMCMLVQKDTKNSLLELTGDRVRNIESLFGSMPEALKASVRKNMFLFKADRIKLSRNVGHCVHLEQNYALLKKMCLKASKDIVVKNIYRSKMAISR